MAVGAKRLAWKKHTIFWLRTHGVAVAKSVTPLKILLVTKAKILESKFYTCCDWVPLFETLGNFDLALPVSD